MVGLVAGWVAGYLMKGSGLEHIGDILVGITGAFIGGTLFGFLLPGTTVRLLGSVVVFVGAVVLILVLRAVSIGGSRSWR